MSPYRNELRAYIRSKHKITTKKGCWLTSEKVDWSVYRQSRWRGKYYPLHRLCAAAFLKFNLDSNLLVLHKCDVKGCFNPEHLFIGDTHDNRNDWLKKRRNLICRPFGLFQIEFIERLNEKLDKLGI